MTRSKVAAAGLALVAGVALVVSFLHLRELCLRAGESELTALLVPLSVDGLLLSAGATMRVQSNQGRRDPLVVLAFVLGVAATMAGNTYIGWQHGTLGALVAAWTPLAALMSFESWIRGASSPVAHGAHQCAHEDQQTLRQQVEELLSDGREWTPREVAVRTGASESYARKLMSHNGTH